MHVVIISRREYNDFLREIMRLFRLAFILNPSSLVYRNALRINPPKWCRVPSFTNAIKSRFFMGLANYFSSRSFLISLADRVETGPVEDAQSDGSLPSVDCEYSDAEFFV